MSRPRTARRGSRPVLAADLGGTSLRAALVSPRGLVLASRSLPLPRPATPARVLRALGDAWSELIAASPRRPSAAGIALKGLVDSGTGVSLHVNGLPGWRRVPVAARLKARLGLPVLLDNDCRAAALGEAWLGAARGRRDFVFLIVGTGIGSGVVRDGRLVRGARGGAGEFGHTVVDASARAPACSCGGRGHWEALAAGPAFHRRAGRLGAERAARETGRWLGIGLYNLARALDCELVVLGGGLSALGPALLGPARRELARRLKPFGLKAPRLVRTRLAGRAGLLGAARLALLRGRRGFSAA